MLYFPRVSYQELVSCMGDCSPNIFETCNGFLLRCLLLDAEDNNSGMLMQPTTIGAPCE